MVSGLTFTGQGACPNAVFLTGFGGVLETVVEQWTGATEFAGRNGRIFAHGFVRDVFREEQFRGTGAGHVVRVVEFDEEVVEAVSVVEHMMSLTKRGNKNV